MMLGGPRQIVVELDGTVYRCSGRTVEQVPDFDDIDGDAWFISDCQEAISRTQTSEAPFRYAEVMVRKHLQEAGEFDEPVSMVTHWKKKKGVNATDIFYTALPTRLYYQYLDRMKRRQDCSLFFALNTVLMGVLQNLREAAPVAVVFQHGRFADLLIGTRKRIYYANRCVAYDSTREQMASLWQTVTSDIEEIERENRISISKVLIITWLDSLLEPELPPALSEKVYFLKDRNVFFGGEEKQISFLEVCEKAPVSTSISGVPEKISFYSKKYLPVLNILVMILCVVFLFGRIWCEKNLKEIEGKLRNNQTQIAEMQARKLPTLVPFEEQLAFVTELAENRELPSIKKLLNDISIGLSEDTNIDVLKANYEKGALEVEVLAKTMSPFDQAHRGYQRFGKTMKTMGYSPEKTSFQTDIHESRFVSKFKKKMK